MHALVYSGLVPSLFLGKPHFPRFSNMIAIINGNMSIPF
jgi:hypothetical protein